MVRVHRIYARDTFTTGTQYRSDKLTRISRSPAAPRVMFPLMLAKVTTWYVELYRHEDTPASSMSRPPQTHFSPKCSALGAQHRHQCDGDLPPRFFRINNCNSMPRRRGRTFAWRRSRHVRSSLAARDEYLIFVGKGTPACLEYES